MVDGEDGGAAGVGAGVQLRELVVVAVVRGRADEGGAAGLEADLERLPVVEVKAGVGPSVRVPVGTITLCRMSRLLPG